MFNYHESWKPLFNQFEFDDINELYTTGVEVYPKKEHLFRVFELDVKDIRVVLLGQDPYHGPGQAHGLSFSVPNGVSIPPSLRNIYKELQDEFPDRNYKFTNGNLEKWFYEEKIFLLNASLSVERSKPNSHVDVWQEFTDSTIQFISEQNDNCVFLLLGNFAKAKEVYIKRSNSNKTNIVKGVHPSPMAAQYGFFGSNVFRKVEDALGQQICWQN